MAAEGRVTAKQMARVFGCKRTDYREVATRWRGEGRTTHWVALVDLLRNHVPPEQWPPAAMAFVPLLAVKPVAPLEIVRAMDLKDFGAYHVICRAHYAAEHLQSFGSIAPTDATPFWTSYSWNPETFTLTRHDYVT
jgi:hypothetical protein